jgi:hypothetical protein
LDESRNGVNQETAIFLYIVIYGVVYMCLAGATFWQRYRLMEWFRQWNSQTAVKEAPYDTIESWTFFFSKRAAQILRPNAFLWRQRQLFVVLGFGTVLLFLAYPVGFFILVCFITK